MGTKCHRCHGESTRIGTFWECRASLPQLEKNADIYGVFTMHTEMMAAVSMCTMFGMI
jgi:hypothetical protein